MPGVLILEALAQVGAVAILSQPENKGKTVYFGGKEERCYEKLDHLEKHLPDHFLRCHKSFLVNMDRIRNFEKHRLSLCL